MANEQQGVPTGELPAASQAIGGARQEASRQAANAAGRRRPYRDVRAGFEPWRKVALRLWAAREEALTLH